MVFGMILAVVFIIGPLKLTGILPEKGIAASERNFYILVFIDPLIEEVISRLPICYHRINLTLSLLFILFLMSRLCFGWVNAIYACLFFLLIAYLLLFRKKNTWLNQKLEQFWSDHFNSIFYFYALTFGLIHMTNFRDLGWSDYLLSPLITSPQLVLGFVLGFVHIRYKNGFWIALLLHILLNSWNGIMILFK